MMDEFLVDGLPNGGDRLLRSIRYTSFDQPTFIQHTVSRERGSDPGLTGVWDGTVNLTFAYGPGLQRLIQTRNKGALEERTLYMGSYQIREKDLNGQLVEREQRNNFGAGDWIRRQVGQVTTLYGYQFEISDHLGSPTLVTGENAQVAQSSGQKPAPEQHSFDAWGARRNAQTWAPAEPPPGAKSGDGTSLQSQQANAPPGSDPVVADNGSSHPRGFTGHEMLDDVGLVHMNGRLYDAFLGRFCSADPYVQSPQNSQNYNRYTYVLNNPLSLVDPSGHFFGIIFGLFALIWSAIGAVFATLAALIAWVVTMVIVPLIKAAFFLISKTLAFLAKVVVSSAKFAAKFGAKLLTGIKAGFNGVYGAVKAGFKMALHAWSKLGPIGQGAFTNATWNGIQVARAGGKFADILKAVAKGAVIGAVSAVVGGYMHGLGDSVGSFAAGGSSLSGTVIHAAAHGVSAGAMNVANGGTFQDGFIGGAIGFGVGLPFGTAGGMIQGSSPGAIAARTAIAAVGGGIGSKLAGGSFADGAYSAAFFHLFNNEIPDYLEIEKFGPKAEKTVALYDPLDTGHGYANGKNLADAAAFYASRPEWAMSMNDPQLSLHLASAVEDGATRFFVMDHSTLVVQPDGSKMFVQQWFKSPLTADSTQWLNFTGLLPRGAKLVFAGCNCGGADAPNNVYFNSLVTASKVPVSIYAYSNSISCTAKGLSASGEWGVYQSGKRMAGSQYKFPK